MYVGIKGKKKPADGNLRFYLPYLQLATGRQRVLLQARFTFSGILKTPLGELTKRRLKALPRQRRSRVLRRVRLLSAMTSSAKHLATRASPAGLHAKWGLRISACTWGVL